MTDIRAPIPPADYFNSDIIGKRKVPVWAIILIIVLIVLLIIIPMIVWVIARGTGTKGGTGDNCDRTTDCAKGLTCNAGSCIVPQCTKPSKPSNINNSNDLMFPSWDITLNWDSSTNTDFYVIYFGSESGFNYETETDSFKFTTSEELLLENVSPLTTFYIRIQSHNQSCGGSIVSDEYTFTAPPIII